MARSAFNISIDISAVEGLADKLGTLTPEAFGRVAMTAVNDTARGLYDLVTPRMVQTLNLTESYVRNRMQLELSTSPNNPTASIIALGSRPSMTQLRDYGAQQIISTPVRPKRAKGDPRHGIPAGMKSGGVSVQVLRGSTKVMPGAFLVELRNGNGWGIATRTGKGKKDYKVRYGPSVYQMFKYTAENVSVEANLILQSRLIDEAERMLENNLNSKK